MSGAQTGPPGCAAHSAPRPSRRQPPVGGAQSPRSAARPLHRQYNEALASVQARAIRRRGLRTDLEVPPCAVLPPIHDRFVAALNARMPAEQVVELDFTR